MANAAHDKLMADVRKSVEPKLATLIAAVKLSNERRKKQG